MGTSRERKLRDNRSNQIAPVSELVFGGSSSSMMMDFNTRWAQSYESTVEYLIAIDLSFFIPEALSGDLATQISSPFLDLSYNELNPPTEIDTIIEF